MNRKIKITAKSFGLVCIIYTGIYIADSLCGGYWPQPVTGSVVYADSGLGMPTLFLWQPRYGYNDPNESTLLGSILAPAIYVDRHLFHRSLDLNRVEDEKLIFSGNLKWQPSKQSK